MVDRTLAGSVLFSGISEDELEHMLPCLGAQRRRFKRDERILRAGQPCDRLGIVLEGRVRTEVSDAWGVSTILETLERGEPFAIGYACSMGEPLDIDIIADTACTVVFLDPTRIMHSCPRQCRCHGIASTNLMKALAMRNLAMDRRAAALMPKTIRGKVLAYLSQQQKLAGSYRFTIPFNQTKLASYLGVDRSALSSELSKLRKEGVIDYDGATYSIK